MGPDRGLRTGLADGAEPESSRQRRLLRIGEVPFVELGPAAVDPDGTWERNIPCWTYHCILSGMVRRV